MSLLPSKVNRKVYTIISKLIEIIHQGRNGIGQLTDRQWVTKYKVAHSMDHENVGASVQMWEFLSDLDGKPIVSFSIKVLHMFLEKY